MPSSARRREKLHPWCFPEIFQRTECQISEKECKKYILFISIMPGVGKHIVPRNFGNQCEQQEISDVFPAVMCMQETFYNKETKDWKGATSDIAYNAVCGDTPSINIKQICESWLILVEDEGFRYGRDQHGDTCDHLSILPLLRFETCRKNAAEVKSDIVKAPLTFSLILP